MRQIRRACYKRRGQQPVDNKQSAIAGGLYLGWLGSAEALLLLQQQVMLRIARGVKEGGRGGGGVLVLVLVGWRAHS